MHTRASMLIVAVTMLSACSEGSTATPLSPTAAPLASLSAASSTAAPRELTTFHSPENAAFHLPLTLTHGPGWDVHVGINTLDVVQGDEWGPVIILVDGAKVADPEDMTKTIPWPDDFFAYFASLPGVNVLSGPEPVTIGGGSGSQVIAHVTSFRPFLWVKGDYTWLGGEAADAKEQLILLDADGSKVLLFFPESPDKFEARYPLVQEIYDTIEFTN